MKRDFLKWFSGKSLEKAIVAADLLEQSAAQDCWVPKASVTVRAAMSKTNVAYKLFSALYKAKLENTINDMRVAANENRYYSSGYRIAHALQFGNFRNLSDIDFDACRNAANGNEIILNAISGCEQATKDFAEVYAFMDRFDAMRPRPVFTTMNASPLVSETLKSMNAASVEVCPIEFNIVEFTDEKGRVCYRPVGRLVWPENIQHGTSGKGCAGSNCEACGHRIKTRNWVPLIITTNENEKKSLWVGRDCAKTLFGVDMKGDLELQEGTR